MVDPTGEQGNPAIDTLWNSYNAGYTNIMDDIKSELNAYKQAAITLAQNLPGTGDVGDAYSLTTGKDLYSGEEVSGIDRAIVGVAAIVPGVSGSEARAGKGAASNLAGAQLKNFERFLSKIPANSKNSVSVTKIGSTTVFKAISPGNVLGSKAIYEKTINAAGKTLQYIKTTFDPQGNIVHIKDKITGSTVTPKK